jgi:hypothetical protein
LPFPIAADRHLAFRRPEERQQVIAVVVIWECQHQGGQVMLARQVEPAITPAPLQVGHVYLSLARFPHRPRDHAIVDVAVNPLVEAKITESGREDWNASRLLGLFHDVVEIEEDAGRRIACFDRLHRKRVSIDRRRLQVHHNSIIMPGQCIVDQDRQRMVIRRRLCRDHHSERRFPLAHRGTKVLQQLAVSCLGEFVIDPEGRRQTMCTTGISRQRFVDRTLSIAGQHFHPLVEPLRVHPASELWHRQDDRFHLVEDQAGLLPVDRSRIDFAAWLRFRAEQMAKTEPGDQSSLAVAARFRLDGDADPLLAGRLVDLLDEFPLVRQQFHPLADEFPLGDR